MKIMYNMKASENIIAKLKEFEGCKLKAYKASAAEKYYTIGYGHYGSDVTKDMKITLEQADAYLRHDIKKFEDKVNVIYRGIKLTQNQFDALLDLCYNAGQGAISQTLKAYIVGKKDKETIRTWWKTHYVTCGGVKLKGLIKRRAYEADLFCS